MAATRRYIAFLRGINVGCHTVKMADLRALFEVFGFANVATFIASGNVIFEAPEADARDLATQIEGFLRQSLGYAVATTVRSAAELAAIAAYRPFPEADLAAEGATLYVAFLPAAPSDGAREKVLALRTPLDDLHVHDREIYWLCRTRMSESPLFAGPVLDRAVGMPVTARNINTVRKLAAKYPPL